MKLIPGSKFVYKKARKGPQIIGGQSWNVQTNKTDPNGLIQNESYKVESIRPQKGGSIIYTLTSSKGVRVVNTYYSSEQAEEDFGI